MDQIECDKENKLDGLTTVLNHCCVQDPSWSEVANFASFLSYQMKQCKVRHLTQRWKCYVFHDYGYLFSGIIFCKLPRRSSRIQRFYDQVSHSNEPRLCHQVYWNKWWKPRRRLYQTINQGPTKVTIFKFMMKTILYMFTHGNLFLFRWENTPHPYVFFNNDGHTVSFFGFFIDRNLRILSEKTGEILHQNIISQPLYQALGANGVKFNVRLDGKSRQEKLQDLCTVFGIQTVRDVDASYELTSDNMMKMWVFTWLWRKIVVV